MPPSPRSHQPFVSCWSQHLPVACAHFSYGAVLWELSTLSATQQRVLRVVLCQGLRARGWGLAASWPQHSAHTLGSVEKAGESREVAEVPPPRGWLLSFSFSLPLSSKLSETSAVLWQIVYQLHKGGLVRLSSRCLAFHKNLIVRNLLRRRTS